MPTHAFLQSYDTLLLYVLGLQIPYESLFPMILGPYGVVVVLLIVVYVQRKDVKDERNRTDRALAQYETVTSLLNALISSEESRHHEEKIRREYEQRFRDPEREGSP